MSSLLSFIESFFVSCVEPFLIRDAEAAKMLLIIFLFIVGTAVAIFTIFIELGEEIKDKKQ